MEYITLNSEGYADVSGFIKCNRTNHEGEFIGTRDEFIPATTGLPAHAFIESIPEKVKGKAIVRIDGEWSLIDDYRGENLYSTQTGTKSNVDYIGPVREGFTLLAPATQYDKWDGEKWVTDIAAQKAGDISDAELKRQALLSEANRVTADWRTELTLGIISSADKEKLIAWMEYIKSVKTIDTSTAPNVNWLDMPSI